MSFSKRCGRGSRTSREQAASAARRPSSSVPASGGPGTFRQGFRSFPASLSPSASVRAAPTARSSFTSPSSARCGILGPDGWHLTIAVEWQAMLRSGYRRASAAYLALFFLAVAAAPHHHLNGLEDLLLDQRSDSGILIQTIGAQGTSEAPAINPYRVVHDVPCLACFTGDF